MRAIKITLLCFVLVLSFSPSQAQFKADTTTQEEKEKQTVNKARLRTVVITEAALYGGALFGLYQLWYKDTRFSGFKFYNDSREWLQLDKFGHTYSAYQQGVLGYRALSWAGVDNTKAAIFGGGVGVIMQTPIEILDGFSEAWGASVPDLVANTAGSALFVVQQLTWKEQRIRMKFSFVPSEYAKLRPSRFGDGFFSQLVQDYNGQTYWLSASPASFTSKKTKFPKWLCLSVGYGIDGVLGKEENPEFYRGERMPFHERQRQYYLSLDLDLTQIKTKSRFLRTLFVGLNMLKIPAPALELNQEDGLRFRPLFF